MKVTKEKVDEIRKFAENISDDARTLRKQAIKLLDICDSLGEDSTDEAYQ
ncbi:MAG: hypothetical protein GXY82_00880 [Methanospirillum sp.]|nr:hypothetical protein [Methanospirillum sp.]